MPTRWPTLAASTESRRSAPTQYLVGSKPPVQSKIGPALINTSGGSRLGFVTAWNSADVVPVTDAVMVFVPRDRGRNKTALTPSAPVIVASSASRTPAG